MYWKRVCSALAEKSLSKLIIFRNLLKNHNDWRKFAKSRIIFYKTQLLYKFLTLKHRNSDFAKMKARKFKKEYLPYNLQIVHVFVLSLILISLACAQ